MTKSVFIWKRIDELTDGYHPEGGLVVIAEHPPTEWEVWDTDWNGERKELLKTVPLPAPDLALPIAGDATDTVIQFPDSGCC